jgi:DNA-directed RNA polymerase subunit alpha
MAPRAHRLEKQTEDQSDRFSESSSAETARESMQSELQWRCVEAHGERLHYGRFAMSPFRVGQANTVGIAMRRALLGEVEGAAVTCARFKNVAHEYSVMDGVQESVLDILLNLKEIVIRSDSQEQQKAFISTIGPGEVTAGDIILPPSLEIPDPTQHIALLTRAVPFDVELEVERDCGYRTADPALSIEGRFYLDSVFMPVRNANYSVHSFENEDITQEILFLEIWTNGSITPEEALYEAARSLIDLFLPFLHAEKKEVANTSEHDHGSSSMSYYSSFMPSGEQITKEVTYKHIFIDQLKLHARAYNCLKRANIHTVSDLLDVTQDDLLRIKNFGKKSVEEVLEALRVQFDIDLPKTRAK